MIRNTLILSAGILAMVCVPASPLVTSAAAQPACTAASFVSGVQVLQPGYSPNVNPGSYLPPWRQTQSGYSLRSEIKQDLVDAFNNAPPVIQARLCKLSGVYINPTGCPAGDVNNCNPFAGYLFSGGGSWGFRSRNFSDKNSTYIAISGGLWYWGAPYHAESFSVYANTILHYFSPWSGGPTITSATPNYPWMTVLASLAHELGHVRWAETVVPSGAGNSYDFGALRNCSVSTGTIDFFAGWDYGGISKNLRPPNRWRAFANRANDNGNYTDHTVSPLIADLYFNGYGASLLNQFAHEAYQYTQPWANLFAAQTPDEDFVETYVLYALLGNKFDNAGYAGDYLQSLPVTIAGYFDSNIPTDLLAGNKRTLAQKVQCVRDLPLPP